MGDEAVAADDASLAGAQETIARQAEEIERLGARLGDEEFARSLREAVTLAAAAGAIGAPVAHSRLLELIVETAAVVIGARAASLFLVDDEGKELVFEVALGEKAEEARKLRVPLGHGVAGLVAASGQPLAVSEAESDPRVAVDIADKVGYVPQSLLCVPLLLDEQVVGVLELLDKEGAAPFTPADMEALGLFANQAAIAIEQSRTRHDLAALLRDVLASLEAGPATCSPEHESLERDAARFASRTEDDASHRRTFRLAALVHEIAAEGENESRACEALLRAFAEYLRSRPGGQAAGTAPA